MASDCGWDQLLPYTEELTTAEVDLRYFVRRFCPHDRHHGSNQFPILPVLKFPSTSNPPFVPEIKPFATIGRILDRHQSRFPTSFLIERGEVEIVPCQPPVYELFDDLPLRVPPHHA